MPGVKRKRGDERAHVEPTDASLQNKISGKLHHSFTEAVRAAKKAKAFEVQRVVKKLKEARKKGTSDVQELEKKLEMIKELDHTSLGRISLVRKIQKIKALAIHPMVQAALTDAAIPSLDSISNDSKHVVLSSKLLAGEVDRLCTALKDLVEPPGERQPRVEDDDEADESAGDFVEKGEEEEEGKGVPSGEDDSDDSGTSQPDPSALQSALSKLGIELESSLPAPPSPSPSSSTSSGDEDTIVLQDDDEENLDDQASWESGSVDSEGNIRRTASVSSASTSSAAPPAKRSKGVTEPNKAGAGSRFLPSLATGFIRGDSDGSDIEDADVAPMRKNRRGQRARKAIWEKKFGRNANHVKKAREEAIASRGRGRGRGGVGRGGASGVGRGVISNGTRGEDAGVSRSRSARARPPPVELPTTQDGGWGQRTAKKAEEKPMHPSWIAKQRLKAKEAVGGMPSQGKKIVFS
ncbi:hypothetical protein FRC09_013469 [Ceratobasidium sp. 395]|nr:hypothetical protein FRC09_013469 [Ceratobasidium sp. 395]